MSRAFVTQSLSSTALCLFAGLILAVSLISSNRSLSGVTQRLSTMEFYWGSQVLPDHPFYVLLMARDRARLWLVESEEEPELRLRLAERRFQSARQLALQQKNELAISTLTKSQLYVLDAARQLEAIGMTASQRQELMAALDHSLYRLELFNQQYPNLDTETLRSLREETAGRLGALL